MDNVERLMATDEITQLKARYFRLLDLKAWTEFEQLFTEDFTFYSVHAVGTTSSVPVATSAKGFAQRLAGDETKKGQN